MRKLEKLISKAKGHNALQEHIAEMKIESSKSHGKIHYTVLCCLEMNKKKRYVREMYSSKEEAIIRAKQLASQYPKSDTAVFADWSVLTDKEWDRLLDLDIDNNLDEAWVVFCQMEQRAVEAWQEGSQ